MRHVLAVGLLIAVACGARTFPGVPHALPSMPQWRAEVSKAVAGEPVRLIVAYRTFDSTLAASDLTFTAVCTTCDAGEPPLTGRLQFTPAFCADYVASPTPSGSICWSASVVFPKVGNWLLDPPIGINIPIDLEGIAVCGRVSAFDTFAPRQVLVLNVNDVLTRYSLDRTGHVPADLGARSTALAPEVIRLRGLRVPASGVVSQYVVERAVSCGATP
jgi:hypothetical protein